MRTLINICPLNQIGRNCLKFYVHETTFTSRPRCKTLYIRTCTTSTSTPVVNVAESDETKTTKILKRKFAFKLDQDVEDAIIAKQFREKEHPGLMSTKHIHLPKQLVEAAHKVFEDYESNDIIKDSKRLWDVLRHREIPVEEDIKLKLRNNIDTYMEQKNPIKPYLHLLEEEDKLKVLKNKENKVNKAYNQRIHNWKPITYTPYRCVQYLATRSAPEFAALTRVFHEIRIRVPDYQPRSLFDFGSGVGTVTWAVDHMWPGICWETLSFDPNDDMNTLADRLFRGGNSEAKLQKRDGGTFFKNYLPYSDKVPYDLVVSAYSLFEVGTLESRSKMLDVLWRKVAPGGMLVLIEQGSNAGYEIIIQAREYLLHTIKQEVEDGSDSGYILSPCPHEKFCPRYFASKTPCNFNVKYYKLHISEVGEHAMNESMSFIVFRRGVKNLENEKQNWPRIVRGVYRSTRHVTVPTCTSQGQLEDYVVTKKRHGKICYKVCKKSEKGDMFPITILKHDESVDNLSDDLDLTIDENNDH